MLLYNSHGYCIPTSQVANPSNLYPNKYYYYTHTLPVIVYQSSFIFISHPSLHPPSGRLQRFQPTSSSHPSTQSSPYNKYNQRSSPRNFPRRTQSRRAIATDTYIQHKTRRGGGGDEYAPAPPAHLPLQKNARPPFDVYILGAVWPCDKGDAVVGNMISREQFFKSRTRKW